MTLASPAASKTQVAYQHLRQRITDGTYSPGFRLVLSQIASELGTSVVPVREAIRMLEAEALVSYVHNVGAQVSMLDSGIYRETMETLSLVEGFATAKSAPYLTATEIDQARELNDQMRELVHGERRDFAGFTRLNQQFHEVLFAHCDNSHVTDLVRRGWARLEALRDSSFGFAPGRAAESVAEHDEILRLIEAAADVATVERAAREHRLNTLNAVLRAFPNHHGEPGRSIHQTPPTE